MGTEALKFMAGILPPLLGVVGVCAAIALFAAILRHFLYEHSEEDVKPLASRFGHVFGTIAAIALVSGGGLELVESLKRNPVSQDIAGQAGGGLVPEAAAGGATQYDNLGEFIAGVGDAGPEHMGSADGQGVITEEYSNGDGDVSNWNEVWQGLITATNGADSCPIGGF